VASGPFARRRVGARTLLVALLAVLLLGVLGVGAYLLLARGTDNPGCQSAQRSASCTRVLFLGNSYTGVNDLPDMFANLAWSGGHRVEVGVHAPGGWSLDDHAGSPDTRPLLASKPWDLVVLQEQSQIPSVEESRQDSMYPAARQLVTEIREAGARPLFFVTWAHRDGWPENGMPDYAGMQAAIDAGYLTIAAEEHAPLAPVGFAWSSLAGPGPDPALWQSDGSHPTTLGTYLAACVFYATIFGQNPAGLGYRAGLTEGGASAAATIAAATVLGDQSRWGLPLAAGR
jgi:hypothetical protein